MVSRSASLTVLRVLTPSCKQKVVLLLYDTVAEECGTLYTILLGSLKDEQQC